jgi:hypothetical protein
VTVNETDRVLVTVTQSDSVVADSAIGVLKPTWVSVNTVVPVRFGDLPTRFSGQINIPSASLMFRTNSAIGFPMDLNARFGARRSAAGDSAFLYIPPLQSRIPTGPGSIEFDQGDVGGFLSQFSSRLPSEFRIEGRTLVNPPDVYNPTPAGVGAVGRNSNLSGTAELQIPLMIGIVSGTYIDTIDLGDTTADGQKDYKIDKNEINKVGSGSMVIEVTNGMPVQVGCVFRLLDIRKQSVLQVPQTGSGLQVAAASVDAQGNVTVPANSRVSFQLSETEVRQFNPAEYVTFALSIVTTPGVQAVRFKTTDYVDVRAWSTLVYRVTP